MNKLFKIAMVLTLALSVSGAAWADGPHHKGKTTPPKAHHNSHKPGPASKEVPGGHHQTRNSVKPTGK
jgi:hypothetical protein